MNNFLYCHIFAGLFIVTSICLLVTGHTCYNNPASEWVPNQTTCVNIYISGIITMFISFVIILAEMFYLFLKYCDGQEELINSNTTIVVNPSPRLKPKLIARQTPILSSSPTYRPKSPLNKSVSKKRPLEIIVTN
jgi:hypothetical protein